MNLSLLVWIDHKNVVIEFLFDSSPQRTLSGAWLTSQNHRHWTLLRGIAVQLGIGQNQLSVDAIVLFSRETTILTAHRSLSW